MPPRGLGAPWVQSRAMAGARRSGKVETLQLGKGFGFLKPDDGGGNIYFHVNGFAHSPHPPAPQQQRAGTDTP